MMDDVFTQVPQYFFSNIFGALYFSTFVIRRLINPRKCRLFVPYIAGGHWESLPSQSFLRYTLAQ